MDDLYYPEHRVVLCSGGMLSRSLTASLIATMAHETGEAWKTGRGCTAAIAHIDDAAYLSPEESLRAMAEQAWSDSCGWTESPVTHPPRAASGHYSGGNKTLEDYTFSITIDHRSTLRYNNRLRSKAAKKARRINRKR